ncbi:hypothetical protein B5M42_013035 [Paenibacillus athensensis]|uniref:Wadjet protein JetD C-terminal domain-containing protein n=1 Tax=Paenibacillus athensensis TaxID=1967502 RepID=A0A4Y8Q6C8_9BACL|nr:Wadjet anti-phage system protein JetD domain-containing protein [Paenibacillus athensensis]MCD1259759.1 hypothetical protein [Paenibacillus athensensis]
MEPELQIRSYLQSYKRATVALADLEAIVRDQRCTYEQFAAEVVRLEREGVLGMVKSEGRMSKPPQLAYRYKVNKSLLKQERQAAVLQTNLHLHPLIRLDAYLAAEPGVWERDWPYIKRVDAYLSQYGLPDAPVPAPERSFALVGDEKWITDKQGKELLKRIQLWDKLQIIPVADPLMMAVNPQALTLDVHRHLILENKTAYHALLPVLPEMPFATLIFGGGYRIDRSLELLPLQLPLPEANHQFYYFGDLDREGFRIWRLLDQNAREWFDRPVRLALPFYRLCLTKPFGEDDKSTQRGDAEATELFLSHFTPEEQRRIRECLAAERYVPQETLPTDELRAVWRKSAWIT